MYFLAVSAVSKVPNANSKAHFFHSLPFSPHILPDSFPLLVSVGRFFVFYNPLVGRGRAKFRAARKTGAAALGHLFESFQNSQNAGFEDPIRFPPLTLPETNSSPQKRKGLSKRCYVSFREGKGFEIFQVTKNKATSTRICQALSFLRSEEGLAEDVRGKDI